MAAAAAAFSSSDIITEGPVLNLINKRLRALRKKMNRISQMEESLSQGKALNKEQEETLRSKSSVLAGIDELEKLRQPLSEAVNQEIQLALEKNTQRSETLTGERSDEEEDGTVEPNAGGENDGVSALSDLLSLVYFGSIFDVQALMSAHDNLLTRTHERNCCLTYDYVTDDDAEGDPLREWDLDLIAMMGGLLISRPVNSCLSHKDALQKCVEHAKLWLANSEQPIEPDSDITYAWLREKLNRIMASDYYTTIPEIRAPVEVAATGGNYTSFQLPVHEPVLPQVVSTVSVEDSATEYDQEEEESENSDDNDIDNQEACPIEELKQEGSEVESVSEPQAQGIPDTQVDENSRNMDLNVQQHSNRGPYHNYRGGRGVRIYEQSGNYYPRNNYRGRGSRGMTGNYNLDVPASLDDRVQHPS
ncbi:hypothetical protein ABFS82_12G108300 [Erythranthe guttata]|uniref:Uncharacterized protein n=1 Tax=Erythranthe guttata TaxID=4155 RepID=A0A022QQC1_ERYGU|nr:PREDICTED: uncharacterized protein LOC105967611 [Erythranthe guttata]EYU28690.1 hypothetical protein MIMGU_mgv1a007116mg [Erythranthe guttata]|eukprot:XP_012847671.1 PREDICTED: uncharacterized protein LOC105967611 [Erythranthe guttata]